MKFVGERCCSHQRSRTSIHLNNGGLTDVMYTKPLKPRFEINVAGLRTADF